MCDLNAKLFSNPLNVFVLRYLAKMLWYSHPRHFRSRGEIVVELIKEGVQTDNIDVSLQVLVDSGFIQLYPGSEKEVAKYEATPLGSVKATEINEEEKMIFSKS